MVIAGPWWRCALLPDHAGAARALVIALVPEDRKLQCPMFFAVAGNNEASRRGGGATEWLRTSTDVLIGGSAITAGMIIASRLAIGQVDIVLIGGTSLFGGEGAAR